MNRAEFVFAAIDVLFHPFQNYIRVPAIACEKDLSFDDRYPACKADLYYKKPAEGLPILINIHGGGYVKGDKKHRKSISEMYADKGWFVINMNYRLAPEFPIPANVEDAFSLLNNLLPALIEKYKLDGSRLVLTGDSSGAYTAAHAIACLNNDELRTALGLPECAARPTGLVGFCGPYDVLAALKLKVPFGMVRSIAESATGQKFAKDYSDVSKYKYLNYIAPLKFVNSDWCPTMLTYAKKDVFCAGQGELMMEALKTAGVPCRDVYSTSIADNHCYHFNYWTKASKKTFHEVFDFLEKVKNRETV